MIAGCTLKLAHDSLGLSQEELARRLGQGKNTLQGWETGRRPLGSVRGSDFLRLLMRFEGWERTRSWYSCSLRRWRPTILDETLTTDPEVVNPGDASAGHVGGAARLRRPAGLAVHRPGPASGAADRPRSPRSAAVGAVLPATPRARFFEHLEVAVERSSAPTMETGPSSVLLRRQAYYFAAWDGTHMLIQEAARYHAAWTGSGGNHMLLTARRRAPLGRKIKRSKRSRAALVAGLLPAPYPAPQRSDRGVTTARREPAVTVGREGPL